MTIAIVPVTAATLDAWVALRLALWPDADPVEEAETAAAWLAEDSPERCDLLALDEGDVIGFAEATIRHDYVNGCDTSPVAFGEGIYVMPDHRRRGVARPLAETVRAWGLSRGCTEIGSDAEIDNVESHALHAALGFIERERVICYSRAL